MNKKQMLMMVGTCVVLTSPFSMFSYDISSLWSSNSSIHNEHEFETVKKEKYELKQSQQEKEEKLELIREMMTLEKKLFFATITSLQRECERSKESCVAVLGKLETKDVPSFKKFMEDYTQEDRELQEEIDEKEKQIHSLQAMIDAYKKQHPEKYSKLEIGIGALK